MAKSDLIDQILEFIGKFAKIIVLILILILLYQIYKAISGGTWEIEDIILGLIILNLTLTITLLTSFYNVKTKIDGHIKWHEGYDRGKKEYSQGDIKI